MCVCVFVRACVRACLCACACVHVRTRAQSHIHVWLRLPAQAKRNVESGKVFRANEALAVARAAAEEREAEFRAAQVG